jgi:protein-disulfide isomerase
MIKRAATRKRLSRLRTRMKKEAKQNGSLPLVIIGVVLVAALVGGVFYYNSAKTPTSNTNRAANSQNAGANRAQAYANAPLGANPPNIMGSPTASVTIEEFADFQCGACASVHPTLKQIQSTYGSRIRFIFRHFPLGIPAHDKAYEAAVATEAVGMQDRSKFWAMQNLLMENQASWTTNPNYRQMWEGYAQQLGIDVEKFKADMVGREAKKRVDDDLARGRALSVDSTPTLLVNGKNIPMQSITEASLRQVIDAEIQNAIKVSPPANGAAAPAGSPAAANTNTNSTK